MTVREALWKAGGRNLIVWIVLHLDSTLLRLFDKLTGAEWVQLAVWSTGALIVGTAVEGGLAKFGKGESGNGNP